MQLRPATPEDAALLEAWRNDPEARRFSFSGAAVGGAEHMEWLRRSLSSARRRIWIGESDGRPVGQIRLDLEGGGIAVVHLAVAPDHRGEGIATAMLHAVTEHEPWGVSRLRAEVIAANTASLRTFEKAGFAVVARTSRRVVLERALSRPADPAR